MKSMRWAAMPVLLLAATACGSDSGSSSSTADWCDLAEEVQGFDSLDDATLGDPTKLKAAFTDLADTINEAVDVAPSEIKDEVKTSADALDKMIAGLEKADYNILDVDQSVFTDLGSEMEAASAKIEAFNKKECGLEPSTDDTTDTSDSSDSSDSSGSEPASGTAREQIAAQLQQMLGLDEEQAKCVADQVDSDAIAELEADPTSMLNLLTECNIDLTDLQPQTS